MIGKIKKFNYDSLAILLFSSFTLTSFFFNNFTFVLVFISFFFIANISTQYGLKTLKKVGFYQIIREDGPTTHNKKKNTPTSGGIFIIIPFLILLLAISIYFYSLKFLLLLFCVFGFFIIGFLDDYLSIKNTKNTGLKYNEKFMLQSLISIIFILLANQKEYLDPLIMVSNKWGIYTSGMIPFLSFFTIVGLSNSVNLTDGLDGLASGCSSIVFYGLGTEILIKGQQELIPFSFLCYAMSGACLGFLRLNKHPARIFMGDAGSLSIGAILGSISILTNSFTTIFIMSGLFIIESLSVMIQVTFFKVTKKLFNNGKRIFLMTPIHHHFELKGIKEEKIVEHFWKINILLVILGIVLKITL